MSPSEPPRIAIFLATSGQSGVDRFVRNLIPEIARRGYLVDVLCVRNHGPYLENLPDNVRLVDLGSKHVYTSIPAVIRYLKRCKPQVLFSDKDKVNRSAIIARFFARVRLTQVVRVGSTISETYRNRSASTVMQIKFSLRYLYPHAHRVIVPSTGAKEDLCREAKLPASHVEAIATPAIPDEAVHNDYPIPDHAWFQSKEKPIILGVGELSKRKDFATLLRAFAIVRQSLDCRLVIVGKGKQKEQLQALAKALGVDEDFDLPGFVKEPYPWLFHADLKVLCSLTEGMPLVLMEALAMGTPVVATDCPSGPREILQGGKYGGLVPMQDEKSLAQAIVNDIQEPPSRKTLRQAAEPYLVSNATDAYLRCMGLPPRYEFSDAHKN
ncbi:MAG: glycosyltransferase [Agarilytica sp.]